MGGLVGDKPKKVQPLAVPPPIPVPAVEEIDVEDVERKRLRRRRGRRETFLTGELVPAPTGGKAVLG